MLLAKLISLFALGIVLFFSVTVNSERYFRSSSSSFLRGVLRVLMRVVTGLPEIPLRWPEELHLVEIGSSFHSESKASLSNFLTEFLDKLGLFCLCLFNNFFKSESRLSVLQKFSESLFSLDIYNSLYV